MTDERKFGEILKTANISETQFRLVETMKSWTDFIQRYNRYINPNKDTATYDELRDYIQGFEEEFLDLQRRTHLLKIAAIEEIEEILTTLGPSVDDSKKESSQQREGRA